jgi:hypothetical protein
MKAFTKEMYDKFNFNIQKYPTLPSIAFALFRSRFLGDAKIPIIRGRMFRDIKEAFYGGIVDCYLPTGQNVKSYDVNSLYPYIMKSCAMPTGVPTYFEGDSRNIKNLNGFVYAHIICPTHLSTPILPYRQNKNGRSMTIFPVGS